MSAPDTDSKARSFTRSQVRPAEQVGAFIADKPLMLRQTAIGGADKPLMFAAKPSSAARINR